MKKKLAKKISYWGVLCPETPIQIWYICDSRMNARIQAKDYRGRYNRCFRVCRIEVTLYEH